MTLKEKLQEEQPYINPYNFKLTKESVEKFEQIADEYAIDFIKFFWALHCKGLYEHLKFEEILEIYKKGL